MMIVFDWDGTLIDSSDKIASCMQQAARDCEQPVPSVDAVRNIIGLGLMEALAQLFPGQALEQLERLRDRYSLRFVEADQQPCDFFPGVEATLAQLKAADFTLVVATGKSRRGLNRVLANLGLADFFHGSRCADETASKPNPQMLAELCEEFSVPPKDAVMVGDTEFDLEMASRIGMPRVGVSYGVHHPQRLDKWQPLGIIDCFSELSPLLAHHYGMAIPR